MLYIIRKLKKMTSRRETEEEKIQFIGEVNVSRQSGADPHPQPCAHTNLRVIVQKGEQSTKLTQSADALLRSATAAELLHIIPW